MAQGLQQTELATRAGVSRFAVQALKGSGKCTLVTMLSILQALGRESELQGLSARQVGTIGTLWLGLELDPDRYWQAQQNPRRVAQL